MNLNALSHTERLVTLMLLGLSASIFAVGCANMREIFRVSSHSAVHTSATLAMK